MLDERLAQHEHELKNSFQCRTAALYSKTLGTIIPKETRGVGKNEFKDSSVLHMFMRTSYPPALAKASSVLMAQATEPAEFSLFGHIEQA